jgi:hypothetical protein
MFSSGWSRFATIASAAAAQAQTTVSSTARTLDEQYRTGQLASNVQTGANQALSSAQQLGQSGWGMLSSLATNMHTRTAAAVSPRSGNADEWGRHHGVDTPADVAAAATAAASGHVGPPQHKEEDWARRGADEQEVAEGTGSAGRELEGRSSKSSGLTSRARKNVSTDNVAAQKGGSKDWDGEW